MSKLRSLFLLMTVFFIVSCGRGTEDLALIGFCEGYSDWSSSEYNLPWQTGESYKVMQGNCRSITHNRHMQFAYDFDMDIGVTVVAARGGNVVIAGKKGGNHTCSGNQVVIDHGDGTYARYLHLSSVVVTEGANVAQGTQLGLSGDEGCTGGTPHLHFDVSKHPERIETIPVTFRNTIPNPRGLIHDEAYLAN